MKNTLILRPYLLFLIGFGYYLVFPYLAFNSLDLNVIKPVTEALPFLNVDFFTFEYFVDLIVILSSFLLGYRLSASLKFKNNKHSFDVLADSIKIPLFLISMLFFLFIILILVFLKNGGVFFSGYKEFNVGFLGQISTLTFLTFYFHNFFSNIRIKYLFRIIAIAGSILLLGLGSRNVVMNGVITTVLGTLFVNRKVLFSPKLYISILLFSFVVLFIGVWRSANLQLNISSIMGNFIAEPIFVLSSASVYFRSIIHRPVFNIPIEIMVSFLNFIPTFVFPEKVEIINYFLHDVQQYSPFGACSIFISLYSNFGYFYFIYVFFLGLLFGVLYRKSKDSIFYRSIYFSAAPLLVFQLYNQYLYAFFKLLFWNSIILPFLIFYFLSRISNKKSGN